MDYIQYKVAEPERLRKDNTFRRSYYNSVKSLFSSVQKYKDIITEVNIFVVYILNY